MVLHCRKSDNPARNPTQMDKAEKKEERDEKRSEKKGYLAKGRDGESRTKEAAFERREMAKRGGS